jgi:selenocysteine-specific elongation factor
MIIATAGHVDHGKTELTKALTGIDTDRLPEEKARGLSIDLGFAYQVLPNYKALGFVDVPGHEKFVRNMLAGVGGIDLGLLVVAADDGIMPQTREHFAILNLLAIDQSVVAITKIDRVDDERILEVQDQIETLFGNAGHDQINVYPLCAPDNEGIDALRNALVARAQSLKTRQSDGNFRMAIDRVFTLKGVGLVVTGMVFSGLATIDDNLVVSCDGSPVRVRGIRAHNQVSDQARAGERCAINIVGRGVSESSLRRGNWLMQSSLYAPNQKNWRRLASAQLRIHAIKTLDSNPSAYRCRSPRGTSRCAFWRQHCCG